MGRIRHSFYKVLRWSEMYTKTDMVYLTKGGFWLTLGQIISSSLVFLQAIAFANLIPPETYGAYKYILSIAVLFSIFSLPGMNTAFSRAAAQGKEQIISTITRARILHSLTGSVVALAVSAYYFLNGNLELSLALIIIAATLPLFETTTTYIAYFTGKGRFDLQTKYKTLAQVVSVTVLIATLFVTDNVLYILLAYFLPLTTIRVLLYFYATKTISHMPKTDGNETLLYGKHLTAMQVLGIVAEQVDKILLWKILGPVQLAIYTFALAVPEQIKGLMGQLETLLFPRFANHSSMAIHAKMRDKFVRLFLGGAIVVGTYILLAPFIFKILFPQYTDAVLYSQIIAFSMMNIVFFPAGTYLRAKQKTRELYISSTLAQVFRIIAMTVLILVYGVLGAVLALTATRFFASFVNLYFYYRTVHKSE